MTALAPAPLHLIEQAAPTACPTVFAMLADLGEAVVLLGNQHLSDAAATAGLVGPNVTAIAAPAGQPLLALPRLRRLLRERGHLPGRSNLHVWTASTLAALRLLDRQSTLFLHLLTPPRDAHRHQIRRLAGHRVQCVLHDPTLAPLCPALGFDQGRVHLAEQPTIEAARRRIDTDRHAIRKRWGVPEALPVIALLSDPPTEAHAGLGVHTIDLLWEAVGADMRLMIHPEQAHRPRAQDLLDRYGNPDRFLQEPWIATPWRVLAGCDAVLCLADAAPLALRYAVAVGLPIVAPDLPTHRAALADADHAIFAPNALPKKLADRLHHEALGLPSHHPVNA